MLIGLKPGIKTIVAVHIQCLLRVRSVAQRTQMGRFTVSPIVLVSGWAATALMAAAAIAMAIMNASF